MIRGLAQYSPPQTICPRIGVVRCDRQDGSKKQLYSKRKKKSIGFGDIFSLGDYAGGRSQGCSHVLLPRRYSQPGGNTGSQRRRRCQHGASWVSLQSTPSWRFHHQGPRDLAKGCTSGENSVLDRCVTHQHPAGVGTQENGHHCREAMRK